MTYFKYRRIEKRYQTNEYFLNQIQKKTLFIEKTLYLKYVLLFMFDNVTSQLIYAKNALQVVKINKNLRDQQVFL